MALSSLYKSFLTAPNTNLLAKDASLNYVTTLTNVNESGAIIKHLEKQQKVVRKKSEKVINIIESPDALCLDVETTLEFVSGGGAYLPNLDDNFLADRVVTFPVIHIIHFDESQKLRQIRVQWDQGSLLKAVEVIGSRGRNWPIKDGKDQIRLIKSSATVMDGLADNLDKTSISSSRPSTSTSNAMRDPHASLDLFAPRGEENHESEFGASPSIAPRSSARPAPRDMNELFSGSDAPSLAGVANSGAGSSTRAGSIAPKAGAGKSYQPSRIFDNDETDPPAPGSPKKSPEKMRMPHPTKYNHFEFHDGHDDQSTTPKAAAPPPSTSRQSSKHGAQWDFEDFATPAKPAARARPHDVRHFALGDDSGSPAPDNTPAPRAPVAQPRRDAQSNIELRDDGERAGPRRTGPPRGQGAAAARAHNERHNDENAPPPQSPGTPKGKAHHARGASRKDLDPQFQMADDSPAAAGGGLGERSQSHLNRGLGENRSKAVNMMNAQWEAADASPIGGGGTGGRRSAPGRDKENVGIKTGGDGMGGRKGQAPGWAFGDDAEVAPQKHTAVGGRRTGQGSQKTEGFWDF